MRLLSLLITISLLAACGWQLRGMGGSNDLPERLDLVAEGPFSPMAQAMVQALHERTIEQSEQAQLHLQLGRESLQKRTVAVTSIGSASQYELTLAVPFQFYREGEQPQGLPLSVSAHRTFDFDPQNTIAKTEEENALMQEMRKELAHRILQHYSGKISQAQPLEPATDGGP